MTRRDGGPPRPFNLRKAGRTAALHGGVGATLLTAATVATAWVLVEPISATVVLASAAATGIEMGSLAFAAEYVIHKLDDPTFDARTTILFDLTGLAFGFLLFVIPAMHLVTALRQGAHAPGALSLLALGLTTFGVIMLRGLLMNLGIVRDGEDADRERLHS